MKRLDFAVWHDTGEEIGFPVYVRNVDLACREGGPVLAGVPFRGGRAFTAEDTVGRPGTGGSAGRRALWFSDGRIPGACGM